VDAENFQNACLWSHPGSRDGAGGCPTPAFLLWNQSARFRPRPERSHGARGAAFRFASDRCPCRSSM